MPTVETTMLFMATALALNLTPGPSILFILSRCLGQGRRVAVTSVFGLATASVIHAFVTALGLSALFAYSPLAFDLIKDGGAAYLVYMGITGFLKGGIAGGVAARADSIGRPAVLKSYQQGLITDLFNPKLLLFFFAFLPQFVRVDSGEPWEQMLILGLLFQVTGIPTNLAVAFAGGSEPGFASTIRCANRSKSHSVTGINTGARVKYWLAISTAGAARKSRRGETPAGAWCLPFPAGALWLLSRRVRPWSAGSRADG
jgi:threonine/homoserine/homoserine lactone efflux protein